MNALTKAAEDLDPNGGSNAINDWLWTVKPDFVPDFAVPLTTAGIAVGIALVIVSLAAMVGTWLERKVSGHIQCRYGPMRTGWHGWLQPLADGIKLILKEDLIPIGADRTLFVLAPALVLAALMGAMAAFPLAPGFLFADINLGIFLIMAMLSLSTIGVLMAGWSSNSKWSLYGAMREAAQVVAYEIPLGISLLVPIMVAGSFNLVEVSNMQSDWFGMKWLIFQNPIMIPTFLLFAVAVLAENKRAPFDLPETESELVAGFFTEYSGIRFSFFFMEEYAAMFLFSVVGSVFFFGGFNSPLTAIFDTGFMYQVMACVTIMTKGLIGLFLMMWVRWTLPRLRIDQVMTMGYKYLTPLALLCVLLASLWEGFIDPLIPFLGN